jgi:hypothetical protein
LVESHEAAGVLLLDEDLRNLLVHFGLLFVALLELLQLRLLASTKYQAVKVNLGRIL